MSDLSLADQGLIYDWNAIGKIHIPKGRKVMLDDETLRDGLQNPSVRNPSLKEKIEILHLMEDLGVNTVTVGLPGAGDKAAEQSLVLTREIAKCKMKIAPLCAARTHENDILPVVRISQQTGVPVEIGVFIGTSPIRRLAEDWNLDYLLRTTEKAVRLAVSYDLPVLYATEDTTRSDPDTVKKLYRCAIECGARAIALCDTVGHATPVGAYNLVKFAVEKIVKPAGEQVRIDWHGHRDRDLAIANSLAAIMAGADQIHAAANSLGERVGNTPIELMLVNLKLMGLIDRDLSRLKEYCDTVARATGTTIPPNYPVFGHDAFRTGSGIHAAAIIKAYRKNDPMLANMIYSGVPSHLFGLNQIIEIGPMSGRSSVIYWLEKHDIPATDDLVTRIFEAAKTSDRILTEDEIRTVGGISWTAAASNEFHT